MRIIDLKQKEVINTCNCKTLGCPVDVEFDPCSGRISAIIIPGPGKILLFSRKRQRILYPLGMHLSDRGRYYSCGNR